MPPLSKSNNSGGLRIHGGAAFRARIKHHLPGNHAERERDVRPVVNDHLREQMGIERCVLCPRSRAWTSCLQMASAPEWSLAFGLLPASAQCRCGRERQQRPTPVPGCARRPHFAGSPRCSRGSGRLCPCAAVGISRHSRSARTKLHCRRAAFSSAGGAVCAAHTAAQLAGQGIAAAALALPGWCCCARCEDAPGRLKRGARE